LRITNQRTPYFSLQTCLESQFAQRDIKWFRMTPYPSISMVELTSAPVLTPANPGSAGGADWTMLVFPKVVFP
jgi:hypothetical protein